MTDPLPFVHIHYLRPPDRKEVFTQRLLHDGDGVKITLARDVPFDPPIRIQGQIALEAGSDAVWFTFPHRWHDIGRFHRADGTFTGLYANILTPPRFLPGAVWETTDLFLDIWVDRAGRISILDEDQMQEALERGWVGADEARRAREEADWILEAYQAGRWPPAEVEEWTLQRALQAAGQEEEPT